MWARAKDIAIVFGIAALSFPVLAVNFGATVLLRPSFFLISLLPIQLSGALDGGKAPGDTLQTGDGVILFWFFGTEDSGSGMGWTEIGNGNSGTVASCSFLWKNHRSTTIRLCDPFWPGHLDEDGKEPSGNRVGGGRRDYVSNEA